MEKNPYSDDYAKASEYLRIALSLLSKNSVPPSPLNFQMGYEHAAGRNETLSEDMNKLLINGKIPSEEGLWQLYRKHFIQDGETLEEMREELRDIIVNIQGEFKRSGVDISGYTKTLNHFATVLNSQTPVEAMSAEVRKVIQDTRSMEQSQHRLESEMSSILTEVKSLRKELNQVKKESLIDALTGISNRKAFDTAFEETIGTALKDEEHFYLLIADIDHFKLFNDTFGHLIGDKVLKFVANTLNNCSGKNNLAARFGGEEFAIIVQENTLAKAEAIAENIRISISSGELKDKVSGKSFGKLTISIGIAQFRINDKANDLIQRADQALYLAKERGRDRIERMI